MLKQKFKLSMATLLARAARKIAPPQLRVSLQPFFRDITLMNNHMASLPRAAELLRSDKPLRLELGGGDYAKAGYVNVDLGACDGLRFDLRKPLPLPDGSVQCIYCEHIFEHFRHPDQLLHVLSECFRVLRVDGSLRAGVPDAGRAFRAYAQGIDSFYLQRYWSNIQPDKQKCPMDELNWLIYMGDEHYHMFDERNFRFRLQEAGFQDIKVDQYDPERDMPQRGHQTIYIQAVKTAAEKASTAQINREQAHELIREMTVSPSLKNDLSNCSPAIKFAVSRLLMLIAGRFGETLAIGEHCKPLVKVLSKCVVPKQEQITTIFNHDADLSNLAVKDGAFQYVVSIIDEQQRNHTENLLQQIAKKLDGEPYSWAYIVYLNTTTIPSSPAQLTAVHSEILPDDTGCLVIYRSQNIIAKAA